MDQTKATNFTLSHVMTCGVSSPSRGLVRPPNTKTRGWARDVAASKARRRESVQNRTIFFRKGEFKSTTFVGKRERCLENVPNIRKEKIMPYRETSTGSGQGVFPGKQIFIRKGRFFF